MTKELYENFKEMYSSFLKEQKEIQESIDNNINRIDQIDSYLNAIFEKEKNIEVFSPRNIKAVYKKNIETNNLEKNKIENENQYYFKYINILDSRIKTLSAVLGFFDNYFLSKENISETEFISKSIPDEIEFDKESIKTNLQILDIQEKERQRIARDLHDTSLQNLTHLIHKIELSSKYIDRDIISAKLELASVNKDLKAAIQEIRNTIFDLRPMTFDDLGLKESFERLIDSLKESSGFDIQSDIEKINCTNSLILMTIFRIVEECMNNAVKHSMGNKIVFSLKKQKNNICSIVVSDNGHSFNCEDVYAVKDRHFGLCILKERVQLLSGKIDIDSKPEKGTTIKILIPLLD